MCGTEFWTNLGNWIEQGIEMAMRMVSVFPINHVAVMRNLDAFLSSSKVEFLTNF
jgi:hypothetical protein